VAARRRLREGDCAAPDRRLPRQARLPREVRRPAEGPAIDFRSDGSPARVSYSWTSAASSGRLDLAVAPASRFPEAGSAEEFLAEHYFGYVRQPDGGTLEYAVEHPRWRLSPALEARLDADVRPLYGDGFAAALDRPPDVAFLAEGSAIRVRRGRRIPP